MPRLGTNRELAADGRDPVAHVVQSVADGVVPMRDADAVVGDLEGDVSLVGGEDDPELCIRTGVLRGVGDRK